MNVNGLYLQLDTTFEQNSEAAYTRTSACYVLLSVFCRLKGYVLQQHRHVFSMQGESKHTFSSFHSPAFGFAFWQCLRHQMGR